MGPAAGYRDAGRADAPARLRPLRRPWRRLGRRRLTRPGGGRSRPCDRRPPDDADVGHSTQGRGEPDDDAERRSLEAAARYRFELSGYGLLQATRPQTLTYALTDSPVGQLAWIVERFKDWTDSGQTPEDAVDRDQMLTNVMLYWLTGTAGSSARLYYETAHPSTGLGRSEEPTSVPTGMAVFPKDVAIPVRRFAERTNNIVHWTEMTRGGHFPAMEVPERLPNADRSAVAAESDSLLAFVAHEAESRSMRCAIDPTSR